MKKIYLSLALLIIAGGSYYVTKSFLNHQQSVDIKSPGHQSVEQKDTDDVIVPDTSTIVPVPPKSKPEEPKDTDDVIVPVTNTIVPVPPKPIKITDDELNALIKNGRYVNDRRIAKNYKIEYEGVSDDDIDGLQQNLTFVQQQVEYENWRGFEASVGGYDESSGKVNLIKIKPIY